MKIERKNICPCGKHTTKRDGYCDDICYEDYIKENFKLVTSASCNNISTEKSDRYFYDSNYLQDSIQVHIKSFNGL